MNCFILGQSCLCRGNSFSRPLISISKLQKTHHGNYIRFARLICADVGMPSCMRGIEHDMQAYAGVVEAGHVVKEMLA